MHSNIHASIYEYGNSHLHELKSEFVHDMYGNDLSRWLYNGSQLDSGRPADLGYFMAIKFVNLIITTLLTK